MNSLIRWYVSLALLFCSTIPAEAKAHKNKYGCALRIDIEIPGSDQNKEDILFFVSHPSRSFFNHTTEKLMLDDPDIAEERKVCVVATFLIDTDTPDPWDNPPRFYAMWTPETVKKIEALFEEYAVDRETEEDSVLEKRRLADPKCGRSTFNDHIADGWPEVPIFVRKREGGGLPADQWFKHAGDMFDQFRTDGETHGFLIVMSHFGNNDTLHHIAYDLRKTSPTTAMIRNDTNSPKFVTKFFMALYYDMIATDKEIQRLLKACPYENVYDDPNRCYYRDDKCRKLGRRVSVNKTANEKYCLSGNSLSRHRCNESACKRFCDDLESWSQCNASCDGWQWSWTKKTNSSLDRYLGRCPQRARSCNVGECEWAKALFIASLTLFLLLVLIGIGGCIFYFCIMKPAPKQRRKLRSSGSLVLSTREPMDVPAPKAPAPEAPAPKAPAPIRRPNDTPALVKAQQVPLSEKGSSNTGSSKSIGKKQASVSVGVSMKSKAQQP